jgi:hypothetical protein
MTRSALLLGIAFLAIAPLSAEARDGCGQGWFFNGQACARMESSAPRYAPRYRGYYAAPRRYGPPRPVGSEHCNYRGNCYRTAPHSCSHPGYTIQDGVCKPYRGG